MGKIVVGIKKEKKEKKPLKMGIRVVKNIGGKKRSKNKERKKKKKPLKMEIQVVKNIGDKKRSRNKERKKRKKTIKNGDSSS